MAANITYNGTTIEVNAGKTATLSCGGKKAITAISVQFGTEGSVTYNGSTTEVESGKTATLSCAGKKMKSNVAVAVNELNIAAPVVSKESETIVISNIDPRAVAVDLRIGVWTYRLWRITLIYRSLYNITKLGISINSDNQGFAPAYSLPNKYAPHNVLVANANNKSAMLSATIGGVDSLSKFVFSSGNVTVSTYAGVSGEVILKIDGNTNSTDSFTTLTYDTWRNSDIWGWDFGNNYSTSGAYPVQAKAVHPEGDSSWSNVIHMHTYSITCNVTNCQIDVSKTFIREGINEQLEISVQSGYELPDTISVEGCNYTYTPADGSSTANIVLFDPYADIVITAIAVEKVDNVVTLNTNWGDYRSADYEIRNGDTTVWSGSAGGFYDGTTITIDHSKVTTVYTSSPSSDRGFIVYYGTTVVGESGKNINTVTIPAGTMFDRILFYDYN